MGERRSPPSDLVVAGRGRAFWVAVDEAYTLTASELELLAEIARLLDQVDALRVEIDRSGLTVSGSMGQMRPNPLLVELRGSRTLLARCLGQLRLPDEVGEVLLSPASAQGRRAAWSRWHGPRSGRAGVGGGQVSRRREGQGGTVA